MHDFIFVEILFWFAVSMTALIIIVAVFALRGTYLAKQCLAEIMVVGKIIPLVKPLKLEVGTFPAGRHAIIQAIYERPASLNNKKVPRRVAVLGIDGFTVALTAQDMRYYFVEQYEFRWNPPKSAQSSA